MGTFFGLEKNLCVYNTDTKLVSGLDSYCAHELSYKVINNLAFSINNLDLQLNVFSFTVYSVLLYKVIWIFCFIRTWSLAFLQSLTIISKKYKKQ